MGSRHSGPLDAQNDVAVSVRSSSLSSWAFYTPVIIGFNGTDRRDAPIPI